MPVEKLGDQLAERDTGRTRMKGSRELRYRSKQEEQTELGE